MKRFIDVLEYIQLRLAALFFVLFILCIILQVASRYIPGISVLWAGNIATYAFIWMVFLGTAIMVKHREHFTVGILIDRLKGIKLLLLRILIQLLIIGFGFIMLLDGYKIMIQLWQWSINSLPQIKQGYIWMALPVSGATIIIYSINNLLLDIQSFRQVKGESL